MKQQRPLPCMPPYQPPTSVLTQNPCRTCWSTPTAEGGLAEMSREVPGGAKPMHSWEKVYWGVGVTGVAAVLYWNLKKPEFTPEEIEARIHARARVCMSDGSDGAV